MNDLLSWKKWWPAETATLREAISLRKQLCEKYGAGDAVQQQLARTLEGCRRRRRCRSDECPVCERSRRVAARKKWQIITPTGVHLQRSEVPGHVYLVIEFQDTSAAFPLHVDVLRQLGSTMWAYTADEMTAH